MWLFTVYGFFSVSWSGGRVSIRARDRQHLETLMRRFSFLTGTVVRTPNRDYRYRLVVTRAVWEKVAAGLASELNWDNFKDEAKVRRGKADSNYIAMLHKVWYEAFRYQDLLERWPVRRLKVVRSGR